MKYVYTDIKFTEDTLVTIHVANGIINDYLDDGYRLTLRQLYYQFVARDWIPNTKKSYSRLGSTINRARLAGYIDWDAIEDRTRSVRKLATWETPGDIIKAAADSYRRDLWESQEYRPEVWIEKDALIGVIEPLCEELRVPCFSCRGYVSQSEMWAAGQRFVKYLKNGQLPVVLHLGDHDPSGIDMTRDIKDRLTMFVNGHLEQAYGEKVNIVVKRLGLSMAQVQDHNAPPNDAKLSDARAKKYVARYGYQSWELDALPPNVLNTLVSDAILVIRNEEAWNDFKVIEDNDRDELKKLAKEKS